MPHWLYINELYIIKGTNCHSQIESLIEEGKKCPPLRPRLELGGEGELLQWDARLDIALLRERIYKTYYMCLLES